jgi:hypothetical protein
MIKRVIFWTYKTYSIHFPGKDSNPESPEYKAMVLFTAPNNKGIRFFIHNTDNKRELFAPTKGKRVSLLH